MRADNPFLIRVLLLGAIAASLALMAAKVWQYRPLLAIPGGSGYVFITASLLLVYAAGVVWATRGTDPLRRVVVSVGTPLGLLGAAIQVTHLVQESLLDLGNLGNGISALGLLVLTLALWGIAGYRVASTTDSVRSTAMAGLWSAVVTMSLLVIFGFVLEFYLAPPKPEYVATWGEFQRSGWIDIHAFTIANTLDSAQSHLIVGPIVGATSGTIGGAAMRMRA